MIHDMLHGLVWFGLFAWVLWSSWLAGFHFFGRRASKHLTKPHRNIVHRLGRPRETHEERWSATPCEQITWNVCH